MNSMGVPGAVTSQVFLGHLVQDFKDHGYGGRDCWDPGFYVLAAILAIGAACWLLVDADRPLAEAATSLPSIPAAPSERALRNNG
jgi:hypothetical protein